MAKFQAPDMRVFDATVANDHALFDACLVRLGEKKSNWTRSKLQGDVPITLDHLRYDTQRKLAAHLKSVPELESQQFPDNRLLLQHIAHMLTNLSAKYIHTWQEPVEEMIVVMRTNLDLVTRSKQMAIQDDNHPLRNHFKKKIGTAYVDNSGQIPMPYIPARSEDVAVTKYIVGPSPHRDSQTAHTEKVLRAISPYLMEINDGQLEINLRELRQRLRSLLNGKTQFTPDLRQQMINVIWADREQQLSEDNTDLFDEIAAEVRSDTGIEDVFTHPDPSFTLDECISKPLAAAQSEDALNRLRRRKPVLEFFVQDAVDRNDDDFLEELYGVIVKYMDKLDMDYGETGHLGLAAFAAACPDVKQYKDMLC